MIPFLFVALVATNVQCFQNSAPVPSSFVKREATSHGEEDILIQDLPSDGDIGATSYLGSPVSTTSSEERETLPSGFVQSQRTRNLASSDHTKGDQRSESSLEAKQDPDIDQFNLDLKAPDWLDIWEQNLDSYSKILERFTQDNSVKTSLDRVFARKNRGRLGRMPLAFGKRTSDHPLIAMGGSGGNSERTLAPNREQTDALKAMTFSESSAGVDSKYASREARGRMQRMPYAFGKRFSKASEASHLLHRAYAQQLSDLDSLSKALTSTPRMKNLPLLITDNHVKKVHGQLPNSADTEQNVLCNDGQKVTGDSFAKLPCSMSEMVSSDTIFGVELWMGQDSPLPRKLRSNLRRMPQPFGKRDEAEQSENPNGQEISLAIESRYTNDADFPAVGVNKRGSLGRMPVSFGKRQYIDVPPHHNDLLDMTMERSSAQGHYGATDKRGSFGRMPLSFGKRKLTRMPLSFGKRMLRQIPFPFGKRKLGRMPLSFGKRRATRMPLSFGKRELRRMPLSFGKRKLRRMPLSFGKRSIIDEEKALKKDPQA